MLIPSSSALVLVEPAETQASHVSFDFACHSQRIIAVAALAGVPVLHAVYSASMRGQPSVVNAGGSLQHFAGAIMQH